jgi:hypothetical protein
MGFWLVGLVGLSSSIPCLRSPYLKAFSTLKRAQIIHIFTRVFSPFPEAINMARIDLSQSERQRLKQKQKYYSGLKVPAFLDIVSFWSMSGVGWG